MTVVEVKTTVGTVFKNPNASILVIEGTSVRKIQARDIKPGMKLVFFKDVLAELTVDDIHKDLMAASNEGALRYQESHRTLHVACACTVSEHAHETTLLRHRLFGVFDPTNPLSPESIRNMDKVQFHQRLFKLNNLDFSKEDYDGVVYYLKERLDLTLETASAQIIRKWLEGEVFLPRKFNTMRLLGRIVDDEDLGNMAFNRFDIEGNEVNPGGLREVALFYRGRRSALMSYVSRMKGMGGKSSTGKGWKDKDSMNPMTDEIEVVLANHIEEISGQLITSQVYETRSLDTPHSAEHMLEEEHRDRELKLSKTVLTPSAERADDLKSEVNALGFHTDGLTFDTWEAERKRTRQDAVDQHAKKEKEEKLVEKVKTAEVLARLTEWNDAQTYILKICFDYSSEMEKHPRSYLAQDTEFAKVVMTAPSQVLDFVSTQGWDDKFFITSIQLELGTFLKCITSEKWNLGDEIASLENTNTVPYYRIKLLKEMWNGSPFLRMKFHKLRDWQRFVLLPEYVESRSRRKNTRNKIIKNQSDMGKLTELIDQAAAIILRVYNDMKARDTENWGEKCKLGAKRVPPILRLSTMSMRNHLTKRQRETLSHAVQYDLGIGFNYATYVIDPKSVKDGHKTGTMTVNVR